MACGDGDLRRCGLSILAFATTLAMAPHAVARGLFGGSRIVLKEGRLADALRDLSVRSGSDLLFEPDVVGDLRNKRVAGALEVEPILARLLDGAGLGYRRVGNGVYIVFRQRPEQPTAVPELLVLGRKTQNADLQRSENDFQGYRVAAAEDVRSSHADNLDQFLRSRQTSNAVRLGPASDPRGQYASNRSEIDLHGLGPTQTLVLVDGARMPGTLSQAYAKEIFQSDLSGLPLLAIDRIESLTGTAGGVYGPGATGGVINVILKRDYRGAELSATYGLTDRGDARRRRVDGRIGFTPNGGTTDIMINVSRAENDGLRVGDRDFGRRALQGRIANRAGHSGAPTLDGVLIQSQDGGLLTLSAALGGASLGSSFTWLPLASLGAGDGSALRLNAGKVPSALSPDGNGVLRSLVSDTTVTSLLLNVRHRFSEHVEATLDFIGWENEGRSVYGQPITAFQVGRAGSQRQSAALAAEGFPFGQPVTVSFPTAGFDAQAVNRMRVRRSSASVLFDLPAAWRGGATLALGETVNLVRQSGWALNQTFHLMLPGAGGEPTPNPFGAWDSFTAALQAYKVPYPIRFERRLRLQDVSLRLGGPVLRRDAGDVSLSLVAERRQEKATLTPWDVAGQPDITPLADPSFSLTTSSLYGELRAPIVSRASDLALLRSLELQLAARHDRIEADIPGAELGGPRSGYDRGVTVYTTGIRLFPVDGLLLRASLATGVLPPTPEQLTQTRYTFGLPNSATTSVSDPARGGRRLGSETPVVELSGGSPRLRPEGARTFAIGFVVNPEGGRGPRVSLDYTHTEKHDEIGAFGGLEYLIAHEALYPGRVVRAPLTAADAAAGFTAGVITQADTTRINIGHTQVDAVDMHLDQGFRVGPDSRLRLYGGLTWTPRLTRRLTADGAVTEYTRTAEGPLRWRGAAGAVWRHGDLTVRLDGQYYGRYQAAFAGRSKDDVLADTRVPAQAYVDAAVTYRLQVGPKHSLARDIELRFGVQNLLDHAPPTEVASDLGYSFYGDPRRRRFEFGAAARF